MEEGPRGLPLPAEPTTDPTPAEPTTDPTTDPTTEGRPPAVGNAVRMTALTQTPGSWERRAKHDVIGTG